MNAYLYYILDSIVHTNENCALLGEFFFSLSIHQKKKFGFEDAIIYVPQGFIKSNLFS